MRLGDRRKCDFQTCSCGQERLYPLSVKCCRVPLQKSDSVAQGRGLPGMVGLSAHYFCLEFGAKFFYELCAWPQSQVVFYIHLLLCPPIRLVQTDPRCGSKHASVIRKQAEPWRITKSSLWETPGSLRCSKQNADFRDRCRECEEHATSGWADERFYLYQDLREVVSAYINPHDAGVGVLGAREDLQFRRKSYN
jgi:hypothetical protein